MSIKKMIPKPIKHIIKKVVRFTTQNYNVSKINVSEELKRRKRVIVKSNIKDSIPLPLVSYELDQFLEKKIMDSPKPFSDMEIILDPYKKTPLCAVALFATKQPCKSRFIVEGDYKEDEVCGEVSEYKTSHRLPIFGLYPDRRTT